MSKRNIALYLVLLLLLGAGVIDAWNQRAKARFFENQHNLAAQSSDQRLKEIADLTATVGKLQDDLKKLAAKNSEPPPPAPDQTAALAAEGVGRPPKLTAAQFARANYLNKKKFIESRYGDLIIQLHLNPEETEKLTELLVSRRLAGSDVAAASLEAGLNPSGDTDTFSQGVAEQRAKLDDEMHTLLGDDGYTALRLYDQGIGQTTVLDTAQGDLASTGEPLTDSQSAQLRQLMTSNHIGHLNDKILLQAQQFLTPTQIQVLRAHTPTGKRSKGPP